MMVRSLYSADPSIFSESDLRRVQYVSLEDAEAAMRQEEPKVNKDVKDAVSEAFLAAFPDKIYRFTRDVTRELDRERNGLFYLHGGACLNEYVKKHRLQVIFDQKRSRGIAANMINKALSSPRDLDYIVLNRRALDCSSYSNCKDNRVVKIVLKELRTLRRRVYEKLRSGGGVPMRRFTEKAIQLLIPKLTPGISVRDLQLGDAFNQVIERHVDNDGEIFIRRTIIYSAEEDENVMAALRTRNPTVICRPLMNMPRINDLGTRRRRSSSPPVTTTPRSAACIPVRESLNTSIEFEADVDGTVQRSSFVLARLGVLSQTCIDRDVNDSEDDGDDCFSTIANSIDVSFPRAGDSKYRGSDSIDLEDFRERNLDVADSGVLFANLRYVALANRVQMAYYEELCGDHDPFEPGGRAATEYTPQHAKLVKLLFRSHMLEHLIRYDEDIRRFTTSSSGARETRGNLARRIRGGDKDVIVPKKLNALLYPVFTRNNDSIFNNGSKQQRKTRKDDLMNGKVMDDDSQSNAAASLSVTKDAYERALKKSSRITPEEFRKNTENSFRSLHGVTPEEASAMANGLTTRVTQRFLFPDGTVSSVMDSFKKDAEQAHKNW